MRVSVLISTYNGEKYIIEQLESIFRQSRMPDEVIIQDDGSTDSTGSLIQDFISTHGLINWVLKKNESNVGWKRNFYNLMCCTSCDLIFPCDQDDIWHIDKIKKMTAIMENNSYIDVLEGQPHKVQMTKNKRISIRSGLISILDHIEAKREKSKNSEKLTLVPINKHFMHVWPGCVLCIRKSFFETIKPYWIEEMPHDAFVNIYAKLGNSYYKYDYEVIDWRRYSNSSTQSVEKSKNNRLNEIARDNKIINNVLKYAKMINCKEIHSIEKALDWNKRRYDLVQQGSFMHFIKLLPYISYYVQTRRFFSDVYYGFIK